MRVPTLFAAWLAIGCSCLTERALAQSILAPSPSDSVEARRLSRLEILADVWVRLEMFHPAVASRTNRSWDSVLVRAIPRVEGAANNDELVRVLNEELFEPLGDPLSYARTQAQSEATAAATPNEPLATNSRGGCAYVDATTPARFYASDFASEIRAAVQRLERPQCLIVDLRWQTTRYQTGDRPLSAWLSSDALKGTTVNRFHDGEFWPERWLVTPASTLKADTASAAVEVPTVFLTNLTSYPVLEAGLDVLQHTRRHAVALERDGPIDEFREVHTYPGVIRVRIHAEMPLSLDGALGTRPDTIATGHIGASHLSDLASAALRLASKRPQRRPFTFPWLRPIPYPQTMEPLSREDRILGLVRLWKEVGSFHAYREYSSVDWSRVLRDWIPRVEAARSMRDYYLTLGELMSRTNDSHAGVQHPSVTVPPWTVPLLLRRVERRVVVVRVDSSLHDSGIARGDEILRIDGVSVAAVEQRLRREISATNEANFFRQVWNIGLGVRGAKDSPIRLTMVGATGRYDVTLRRSADIRTIVSALAPGDSVVRRVGGNIGYINLYFLRSEAAFDSAMSSLLDTRALIIDARSSVAALDGFTGDLRSQLIDRFLDEPVYVGRNGGTEQRYMSSGGVIAARTERLDGAYVPSLRVSAVRYRRPLVMIVNELVQSQGEALILPMKISGRATFVGTRSAATNGGTDFPSLPGGGVVTYTLGRQEYPGAQRYHGIGIVPDVIVEPTIRGIRAGRDEVLERALEVAKQKSASK